MEYLVLALLGALGFGFYQFRKRQSAEVDAMLGTVKGRDSRLAEEQLDVKNEIKQIDDNINKIKEEQKQAAKDRANETDEERAKKWNK